MEASAPVDAGWDGLSGSLPARQEPPEAPPKRAMIDDMELAQDQCRSIPSEVLQDTTCQQKPLGLSFRCCDKKTCPRCVSQHQIEGGYEDPVEYLSVAVLILEKLEAYKTHANTTRRAEDLQLPMDVDCRGSHKAHQGHFSLWSTCYPSRSSTKDLRRKEAR